MGGREGPQEEPGTFGMWGAPWEHDNQWLSQRNGVQSQDLAVGGYYLAVEGREERVEVDGRGGLGLETSQKMNRSHSPHSRGCRCWGMCFGCPGLYP